MKRLANVIDFPPSPPGTLGHMRWGLSALPHVAEVHLLDHPGVITIYVWLRWYAWLTVGLLHFISRRRVKRWVDRNKAAGVRADIVVL